MSQAARVFLFLVTVVALLQPVAAHDMGTGDCAGRVDIGGGRKIYLECRGRGSPTVVLISGEAGAATAWTMADPAKPAPTVFSEVARFTRVCAYDRPGALVDVAGGKTKPSRSDPVPQPVASQDAVRDLHALLRAANEPGPYILVGHSFGGLVARLYASTYPNEVTGMVLVDPASEAFQAALVQLKTYDTWKATRTGGRLSLTTDQLAQYPELERLDYDRSFDQLRAAAPLRPMPLVLLSSDHSIQKALEPLIAAGKLPPGIPADFGSIVDQAWKEGQDHDAKLVPTERHITKTDSGHNIQLEQPQLVVDAIREVVDTARNSARSKDFAGLVDIGGGRKVYLKCSGTGSPTVVLVGGLRASAEDWSVADKSAPAVFPQVGKFTRVCAYDRPGTPVGEKPSRSDPVPQPTTARDAVGDLHALLGAAGETGPYVLVGHSYGGLIVKLYASAYPKDVAGLVLVDALSEGLQDAETHAQWVIQRKLIEGDVRESVALYPALERIDTDRSFDQVRAAPPLRSIHLVVLSADRPWGPQIPSMIKAGKLPKDVPPDFGYVTDAAQKKAQEQLAKLVPNAKHIAKTNSGHEIHKEQPRLVIEAIREVVDVVRDSGVSPRNGTDTELPPINESSRIALEKALDDGFAKSGLPGVTVGLWVPGTGSWIASRGLADLKTKALMTAGLQAPIGSITKSFTATIALQLVEEGKLRLVDTIDRWYPQVSEASAITIKMLLNHSSGLPDISKLQLDLRCTDPNRLVSPEELIAMGTKLPRASFPPGKGSLYSSMNTIVLGRILEKIAGESFDSLVNERLLEPLALRRTKLDTSGKLDPPFSHGYTDFCPNMPRHTDTSEWPQFSFAAGALASTLSDLHRWGVALGEGFGLTPALRQARIDDELGVAIQRAGGRVISFGHAGSEPGYSANVQYYPCTGAVWALMANGDGGTGEAFVAVLKPLQPIVESLAAPPGNCTAMK